MFYTNIFMYFRIIKPWNHPIKLRITNMNMYYIQRCHTRTCIRLPGQPLLVCTVWMYCVDVLCGCTCTMHVEYTRSDRLPNLCAINLTFVKRLFAKLYYVNLGGTFVVLIFCILARFSHVRSKNKQMMTWPFQWYRTCMVGINRKNVRNNSSKRHQ